MPPQTPASRLPKADMLLPLARLAGSPADGRAEDGRNQCSNAEFPAWVTPLHAADWVSVGAKGGGLRCAKPAAPAWPLFRKPGRPGPKALSRHACGQECPRYECLLPTVEEGRLTSPLTKYFTTPALQYSNPPAYRVFLSVESVKSVSCFACGQECPRYGCLLPTVAEGRLTSPKNFQHSNTPILQSSPFFRLPLRGIREIRVVFSCGQECPQYGASARPPFVEFVKFVSGFRLRTGMSAVRVHAPNGGGRPPDLPQKFPAL